jgi:signal transduction histidine kinase
MSAAASIVLEIEDDGAGFGAPAGPGMGMVSMRERAEMLHGSIEFLEGRHGGALVRLTVPVQQEIAIAEAAV